jgi:hypothetical protein
LNTEKKLIKCSLFFDVEKIGLIFVHCLQKMTLILMSAEPRVVIANAEKRVKTIHPRVLDKKTK